MSESSRSIKDTDKARNLSVEIDDPMNLEEVEAVLFSIADTLSLKLSHVTTLSRKKYTGNRHWHFKCDLKSKGCLDVTYWPDGALFWITMRNYEPDWVREKGTELFASINTTLKI